MTTRFHEKPWKYPYYIRAIRGKVSYSKAFKRKRDAQSAAKDLRDKRGFRVSVIKRKR